jgi:hypothetical protein
MKKESGFYADSLEMLLDTMCNVLGAIVFITLALAVLVRSSTSDEAIRQQTAALTNELAQVAGSNAWVTAELQRSLERLQQRRQAQPTNQMRLPGVTSTDKRAWFVVVQDGRLFPVYRLVAGSAAPQENRESLEWHPRPDGGTEFVAKAGAGEEPEAGLARMVRAFQSTAKTNFYFAFLVRADSFAAFNRVKEDADKSGFQCGWEPFAAEEPIILGRRGQRILPQN